MFFRYPTGNNHFARFNKCFKFYNVTKSFLNTGYPILRNLKIWSSKVETWHRDQVENTVEMYRVFMLDSFDCHCLATVRILKQMSVTVLDWQRKRQHGIGVCGYSPACRQFSLDKTLKIPGHWHWIARCGGRHVMPLSPHKFYNATHIKLTSIRPQNLYTKTTTAPFLRSHAHDSTDCLRLVLLWPLKPSPPPRQPASLLSRHHRPFLQEIMVERPCAAL